MLCDNPNRPEFHVCNYCCERICYCKCNLCDRCYYKCRFCGGPHPESVCIAKSDDSDDNFDDSISSYSHTDSNQESSTEYSDLSKTESVTIDEHPFLNTILNIPHPQLINVQTQTEGRMMIVDCDEFEVLEKVHALNSYLKGI